MKRSNVDILFDSVYTIKEILSKKFIEDAAFQRDALQANIDHIKLCLGKEEYISVLTLEQTAELNATVADAEIKIKTLPVNNGIDV